MSLCPFLGLILLDFLYWICYISIGSVIILLYNYNPIAVFCTNCYNFLFMFHNFHFPTSLLSDEEFFPPLDLSSQGLVFRFWGNFYPLL